MAKRKSKMEGTSAQMRQEEFIREYLINGNKQTRAYMKVFNIEDNEYAAKAAHKMMKRPAVAEALVKEREKLDKKYEINRGVIVKELMDVIELCKDDDDRANILKSLEILNKMAAFYTHKQEIDIKGSGITFNFVEPTQPKDDDKSDDK